MPKRSPQAPTTPASDGPILVAERQDLQDDVEQAGINLWLGETLL